MSDSRDNWVWILVIMVILGFSLRLILDTEDFLLDMWRVLVGIVLWIILLWIIHNYRKG